MNDTLTFETAGGYPSNKMLVNYAIWGCGHIKDGVDFTFAKADGTFGGGRNLSFADLERWYKAAKKYREQGEKS